MTSASVTIVLLIHVIMWSTIAAQHLSEVRLVNGTSRYNGVVEILDGARSAWLTVCHTTTWGISDAVVVCRQLGLPAASRAFTVGEPNPDLHIPYYDQQFNCLGNEAEVNDCQRLPIDHSALEACTPGWTSCHDERYIGCFGDVAYDRVLTAATHPLTDVMSPLICIDFCKTMGFYYAAVEYASECYCGAAGANYARKGQYDDNHCHVECAGTPSESCGGVGKMAVFTTSFITTPAPTTTIPTTLLTTPATTTTAPPPSTASPITPPYRAETTMEILPTRLAPSTAGVIQTDSISTSSIPVTGGRISPSTIAGLASTGGILVLVCVAVLVIVALVLRRRRRKASIMEDPSPYALSPISATVEVIMDTTYLDPMNSLGDSAVYSGLSHVTESDFDSSFGGGGGGGGDSSMYLGLSFREIERRQEDEYASLNSALRKDGSFATTQSVGLGMGRQQVYGDGSGMDTSRDSSDLAATISQDSGRTGKDDAHGFYDEPHNGTKSAIYSSANGLSSYGYGFGPPDAVYSPVHPDSYCEVGEAEGGYSSTRYLSPPMDAAKMRRNRLACPVESREYASVFPFHSKYLVDEYQTHPTTDNQPIKREYAKASDCVPRDDNGNPGPAGTRDVITATLSNSLPSSDKPGLTPSDYVRPGVYDSVYFEDNNKQQQTLPNSGHPDVDSVPFPSVLYSEYASIRDEHGRPIENNLSDDPFPADESFDNNEEEHSYSYVDHKKLLMERNKKMNMNDLTLPDQSPISPGYENVNGRGKSPKASPKLSVSSIMSQISPRGHMRKYASLDEESNHEQEPKSVLPLRGTDTAPSATMPRSSGSSEVEYAVVDKAFRNSEPAYIQDLNDLDDDDDNDYDVLQHSEKGVRKQ